MPWTWYCRARQRWCCRGSMAESVPMSWDEAATAAHALSTRAAPRVLFLSVVYSDSDLDDIDDGDNANFYVNDDDDFAGNSQSQLLQLSNASRVMRSEPRDADAVHAQTVATVSSTNSNAPINALGRMMNAQNPASPHSLPRCNTVPKPPTTAEKNNPNLLSHHMDCIYDMDVTVCLCHDFA